MELFLDSAKLDAHIALLKAGLSQEFSFAQTQLPELRESIDRVAMIAEDLVDGISDLHRYWPLTVTVDTDESEASIRSAMSRAWYRKLHYNLAPSLIPGDHGDRLNVSRLYDACEELLPYLEAANVHHGPVFASPRGKDGDSHPSFLGAVSDFGTCHYERCMPSLYWNERWRQPGIDPPPTLTEHQVDDEFLEFVRTSGWDFRHSSQVLPSIPKKKQRRRQRQEGEPLRKTPQWIDAWINADRRRKTKLFETIGESIKGWSDFIGCSEETVVKTEAWKEALVTWGRKRTSSIRLPQTTDPARLAEAVAKDSGLLKSLDVDDSPEVREWIMKPGNLAAYMQNRDES